MGKIIVLGLLIFAGLPLCAQVSGIVKDSLSNHSISYVNIWVENEHIGTNADENGKFILNVVPDSSKFIILSAMGYKTKKVPISKSMGIIYLNSKPLELSEVVIKPVSDTAIEQKIGSFKKSDVASWFGVGTATPWIIARQFPYKEEYSKTPYIRKIKLNTSSEISGAKFNIRLYSISDNGEPGEYIYNRNIFGFARKGNRMTEIDISQLGIRIPENGFFIAFEWLVIEQNKIQRPFTDRSGEKSKRSFYEPALGALAEETGGNTYMYFKGAWRPALPHTFSDMEDKYSLMAVEITLSN